MLKKIFAEGMTLIGFSESPFPVAAKPDPETLEGAAGAQGSGVPHTF